MRSARTFSFSALALSALVWLSPAVAAEPTASSIAPAELHARQQTAEAPVILDVRTAEEFAAGHIAGAVNIPHTDLESQLSEIAADAAVAVYCMVGPRARLGEKILLEAGRTQVLHIEGGLAAWKSAGLPVEGVEGVEGVEEGVEKNGKVDPAESVTRPE